MEEISWTNSVRNEVLHRVMEDKNNLHTVKERKAKWIGKILRRNCLLKQDIEGKQKEGQKCLEDDEEELGSYCMTLSKREDTVN